MKSTLLVLSFFISELAWSSEGAVFRFEFEYSPKSQVIVNEYRTTWLGGTTNKRHSAKTDSKGRAVIEFSEDNYHYFNSHVCAATPDKMTYCQDIALFPKSKPTCFASLAKNQNCTAEQIQYVCQFQVEASEGADPHIEAKAVKVECQKLM